MADYLKKGATIKLNQTARLNQGRGTESLHHHPLYFPFFYPSSLNVIYLIPSAPTLKELVTKPKDEHRSSCFSFVRYGFAGTTAVAGGSSGAAAWYHDNDAV